MRILFMGTPDFACSILEALWKSGEEIAAVLTQPDKPQGRKMVLTAPPVKIFASEHGIPVYQPVTLRNNAFLPNLQEIQPELIVVAAYGKILPPYVLDFPKYGCINAHASLLPRHRGAAPIQRAILADDSVTGVTAMYMNEGLDTGDMILKIEVPITESDDFGSLHDKLAEAGGHAMVQAVTMLKEGTARRIPQDDSLSTYAAKIENADSILDFRAGTRDVFNRIRALSPSPLAVCRMPDGKKLKIISAQYEITNPQAQPGTVTAIDHGTLDVACSDGILHITGVQPEGKNRMNAADFLRGRKIATGDILTPATV